MAKHILIVDDSKTVRNLVAFIMKKEGFKVTAAEDGLDGLEKLYSEQKIDLIISDINMPRMDGITFIKTVREQDAYRDIPIVVLSTEGQENDIQRGLSIGCEPLSGQPAPEIMSKTSRCFGFAARPGPHGTRPERSSHVARFMDPELFADLIVEAKEHWRPSSRTFSN
jgi:two-component system chemotaxis response regulator CheY